MLSNLGYAQFLSGERALAEQTIREALQLGGASVVESLHKDLAEHRVEPTDTQFEKMLAAVLQ